MPIMGVKRNRIWLFPKRLRDHALGKKYFGTSDAAKFVEIFGRIDDPESVYLRLVPEDGLTWEYGSN